MNIEIELFGQLLPRVQRRQTLSMERPLLVREVADIIGLKPEEVGLITIDGVQSEMEDSVKPGCRLCFFPHMSGG
jgi:molybdopterin converting factor small subunit